jgi:hypothetical protein
VRAETEISLQHTPRHTQYLPHCNTWVKKVPDTVALQLPQKGSRYSNITAATKTDIATRQSLHQPIITNYFAK